MAYIREGHRSPDVFFNHCSHNNVAKRNASAMATPILIEIVYCTKIEYDLLEFCGPFY